MTSASVNTAENSIERAAPATLGRYRVLSVLAAGSMGTLYRCIDPRTQRPVVIKTARADLLTSAEGQAVLASLRAEAELGRGLEHPGIVATLDSGEENSIAYVVLEYVEGESLQQHFDRGVAFSVARAVAIMAQVLDALQFAHERGVAHRDIKPANILLTSGDQVKLADFGIARVAGSPAAPVDLILGTPGYVAPETYLTDSTDARADIFAAGAVLYQLLAGTPPFTGTAAEIMFKVCHESPVPPSIAGASAAIRPLDSAVMRALARKLEDRFACAAAFREALGGSL